MASKFRDDSDWDRMASIPAPLEDNPIAHLMASVNQRSRDPLSEPVAEAVWDGIRQLSEKEQWILEAVFIWGMPYSQLSQALGLSSKSSSHKAVQRALSHLGDILATDHRILKLMSKERNMKHKTWQDASWANVRVVDRSAEAGKFMPEMFDRHFQSLGALVRNNGDHSKIADICWSIGCEASRGLVDIGAWDTELMQDTLCKKQHDYGHDNINAFGMVGVAVRLSDKIARYKNLQNRTNAVANESLVDTLMDMVGYAVLAKMLEDGSFQLELVEEDPF